MTSILKSFAKRAVSWWKMHQSEAASAVCQLGQGAKLGPEAIIDNIRGDRGCISLGDNSYCRGHLLTYGHGGRIKCGSWCYIGVRTEIWSMQSIEIGSRVLIAHDVNIHDGTAHSLDARQRHNHFRHIVERGHPSESADLPGVYSSPVVIEDDVWISFGVTILKGVRIGTGSVIAARSIVAQDVPAGVLYRNEIQPTIQPIHID
jgi:maltose O-acetyltransferase